MENIAAKADFLKNEYAKKLAALHADTERKWGKMNVQQMIEHMSDYVRVGYGKTILPRQVSDENLPRAQAFLQSEKPFRENTPNSLMSETPADTRLATKEEAIQELQSELNNFFDAFANEPGKRADNPFFGALDYDMSVQLLHKHAWHHLRQFGAEEANQ